MVNTLGHKAGSFLTRHPLLIAFAFIFMCLLPVMSMRDFSPSNELRYLRIADEAIAQGHLFAFTLDGEAYADKPPLYLWLIMLFRVLLGRHSMLMLSLLSLVPAFVTVYVMDRWLKLDDHVDRLAVCFMMMSCALFLGMSVFLRMDMMMSMAILLSISTFYRMYRGEGNRRNQEIMLPVWIFIALFTKGPVGLLMPLLVIAVFLIRVGRAREIGSYLGWKTFGIIAALCSVWFLGVYLDGGKGYLENLLFHQTLGRAVNSFHHKNPFWYYLMTFWYVVAPYCLLFAGAVVSTLSASRRGEERSDLEVLSSVAVVSTTVMLSCFSGKLAIYYAPVMPFLVLLLVEVVRRTGWKKWMTWCLGSVLGAVGLALVLFLGVLVFGRGIPRVASLLSQFRFLTEPLSVCAVLMLISGVCFALVLLHRGKANLAVTACIASLFLAVYTASPAMPRINDWVGFANLCETIPEGAEVSTVHVRRSSNLSFFLGHDVVDYGKDFDSFRAAVAESPDSTSRRVLVVKERKLASNSGMDEFVKGHEHWTVGPWCLVSY